MNQRFYVSAPKYFEGLVQNELHALGCQEMKPSGTGVYFEGKLEDAYKVVLWSRLANRVLMPLLFEPVGSTDELYELVRTIVWEDHFDRKTTFLVDVAATSKGTHQTGMNHSLFIAQRVKDAIVDRLLEKQSYRPSVDKDFPSLRVHVAVTSRGVQISLDLGGGSLHMRGYRPYPGQAPLKENLAAGILTRAGWLDQVDACLVDPLCGTGTLLLEGAMMALNIAPGLGRSTDSMRGWTQFPDSIWSQLVLQAEADRKRPGEEILFFGYDRDSRALEIAQTAADQLGISRIIKFQKRDLSQWDEKEKLFFQLKKGLIISNPPYGERLDSLPVLNQLYRQLGSLFKNCFGGWKASVFTANDGLAHRLGLRAIAKSSFKNGPLDCSLFNFGIPEAPEKDIVAGRNPAEDMLFNRLVKNKKKLAKWLKKENITCYRHYDADMPEYNAAVDVYEDQVVVSEYAAPDTIDPAKVEKRRFEMLNVIPDFFQIPPYHVYLKVRQKQKGRQQYARQAQREQFSVIQESGLSFLVNLVDYLDTGIFLDHRPVRQLIRQKSSGVDFLNLFGYTGTATIYSIAGGAKSTTTVDLSGKYLEWAEKNLELNGFQGKNHRFEESDTFEFLKADRNMYDLIFLDPPSFSNSKKFRGSFDVQRDHAVLVALTMSRLRPNGLLIFSNNLRGFAPDMEDFKRRNFYLKDISKETIPVDFERRKNIHSCYLISRKPF